MGFERFGGEVVLGKAARTLTKCGGRCLMRPTLATHDLDAEGACSYPRANVSARYLRERSKSQVLTTKTAGAVGMYEWGHVWSV